MRAAVWRLVWIGRDGTVGGRCRPTETKVEGLAQPKVTIFLVAVRPQPYRLTAVLPEGVVAASARVPLTILGSRCVSCWLNRKLGSMTCWWADGRSKIFSAYKGEVWRLIPLSDALVPLRADSPVTGLGQRLRIAIRRRGPVRDVYHSECSDPQCASTLPEHPDQFRSRNLRRGSTIISKGAAVRACEAS